MLQQSAARPLRLLAGSNRRLLGIILILALWYGLCLSSYSIFLPNHPGRVAGEQVIAACIKMPLLLVATGALTLLGACLANLLVGRPFTAAQLRRISLQATALMAILLTLESPATLLTGIAGNYALCVLVNYLLFTIAGLGACIGAAIAFHFTPRNLPRPWRATLTLIATWTCLFALTGATLGYSLRPYIGYSGEPFTWLRAQHATIFDQIHAEWHNLLGS